MAVRRLDFIVLIPCYNNANGLRRSLRSISYPLSQYGLLIVDDGSDEPLTLKDLGPDIPQETQIIRLSLNGGITAALNAGLQTLANRENFGFVARLDCGDICSRNRFVRQVAYLTAHPEVDLLGSWVRFRDINGKSSYLYKTPVGQKAIERGMHFRNLFIHPSVMWRASALTRTIRYPDDLPHAEDYGFFCKLLTQGRAAILPEELVTCELNPNGLSVKHRRQQLRSRGKAVLRYRRNLLLALLGALKLAVLQLIPYRVILALKYRLY
jgi:glycosyltransferase involved in cell wall biosynthesis